MRLIYAGLLKKAIVASFWAKILANKNKNSWLRQWRKSLGLTQKRAAALLGLKHRMIQNYESGTHEVPRYVRLSCYAIGQCVVDFDADGPIKSDDVAKVADMLRDK